MRELVLPAKSDELANALDFISNSLGEFGIDDRTMIQNAMLATEESLVQMLEHSKADSEFEIAVKKNLVGNVVVKMDVPGEAFDFYENMGLTKTVEVNGSDDEKMEDQLRGVVLTEFSEGIKYENKKNVNSVQVILKKI